MWKKCINSTTHRTVSCYYSLLTSTVVIISTVPFWNCCPHDALEDVNRKLIVVMDTVRSSLLVFLCSPCSLANWRYQIIMEN